MRHSSVTRENPRISVNKLASYLTGTESNRIRILEDQKNPTVFKSGYYVDAQRTISKFAATNCSDREIVVRAIESIESKPADSDWKVNKKKNNIEAIKSFLNSWEAIPGVKEKDIVDKVPKSATLDISGVEVSIRPEIISILSETDKNYVGAIKLYFSTTDPLDGKSAKYISTLTHLWAENELTDSDVIAPSDQSLVFDVFEGKAFQAPRFKKRRRTNISAACKGINLQWDQI